VHLPVGLQEGGLIAGLGNRFIATLVERYSRFVMLAKFGNKNSHSVVTALIKQSQNLPKELYESLNWGRVKEMSGHRSFTLATDIDVFFCDPHIPWQRGTNKNTNQFLRQYFPKGTDFLIHSQLKLSTVARQLNERTRKALDYETPAERFQEFVASIC
jgi:IS30 family transposase